MESSIYLEKRNIVRVAENNRGRNHRSQNLASEPCSSTVFDRESRCTLTRTLLVVTSDLISDDAGYVRKTVLELGSGVGFLGIVVATIQLAQSRTVGSMHLTDVNPDVLTRCAANLRLSCSMYLSLILTVFVTSPV